MHKGTGRPSTTTTDDNIKRICVMVLLDRWLTIDEVPNRLQISHSSAYEIIHNFHKVCARWIPKQLTMLHKQTRLHICQQNLDRYDKDSDAFLDRIITDDETRAHHYEPECKWQIMEWKLPQSSIRKKLKSQPSAGKLMLTVFWDSQGPILEHYQERWFNNEQCSLEWDAYWQAEAWNSKQTSRTTVERQRVVAWQCPSAYCCPHSWNPPETQVWGIGSPSV